MLEIVELRKRARAAGKAAVAGHVGDALAVDVDFAAVPQPFENLRARANAHDPSPRHLPRPRAHAKGFYDPMLDRWRVT